MDERILSDDGHWWWDGSDWLPVEENSSEPINQPLKVDDLDEDKSTSSSKRPSSGPPDFDPVNRIKIVNNLVITNPTPDYIIGNSGFIDSPEIVSTQKPPSSLRIILIMIISLFLLFSLLLLFGYWSIPSELRDSFVFSG